MIWVGLVEDDTEEALLGVPAKSVERKVSRENGVWWALSSSKFVTELVSSTGDDMLDEVFGRDMALNSVVWSDCRLDA